ELWERPCSIEKTWNFILFCCAKRSAKNKKPARRKIIFFLKNGVLIIAFPQQLNKFPKRYDGIQV
ncbi:MAG: hypothetical protein JW755_13325, partial [Candidatus Aminicenantes bacterium]|nr:hypothetical protein [Candidatus Aminicenantes bacterium]